MSQKPVDTFQLTFLGIGPQRTASSWLDQVLRSHPAIALPRNVKETMFFDSRFEKGLAWYTSHFPYKAMHRSFGEIAPTYFDDAGARERVASYFPELRIIINVRNPVERAFSLYRHHLGKGRVTGSFLDAVREMPRIMESGHYRIHCPAWEARFGRERVLYLIQEDIQKRPSQVLENVCSFLDLNVIPLPQMGQRRFGASDLPRFPALARLAAKAATELRKRRLHNLVEFGKRLGLKSVYRGGNNNQATLTRSLFSKLQPEFEEDLTWLETRLGRDLSSWRTFREKT